MIDTVDTPPELTDAVTIGPFAAAGLPFQIVTHPGELADRLRSDLRDLATVDHQLSPTTFLVARRGPTWMSHPWGVWRDGEPCETTVSNDYIGPYVLWEITRLVLEAEQDWIPVHAAAVTRNGRSIVLAGTSHSGKSTLSGWLTAHGWGFLTDEVALIDTVAGGPVVSPFWRPIGVRRGGPLDALYHDPSPGHEILVPATTLGSLGDASPLVAMVFPKYVPDSEPALLPQPPASAVRALTSHLPTLGSRGRTVFHQIVDLVNTVPVFSLEVDDLDAADVILRTLVEGS